MSAQGIRDDEKFQILLHKWHAEPSPLLSLNCYNDLVDYIEARTASELQQKVIEWAKARQIIPNARAGTQLMKAGSELGELFDAEIKGDRAGIIDAVGDVTVCLIIYAHLNGLTFDECLVSAYDEIKDRTGTLLPSGVFVKD